MSAYRPQSDDVTSAMDRATFDRLRAMTPEARLRAAAERTEAALLLTLAGLRLRHPAASDDELRVRAAVQRYGRPCMARCLGEDALRGIP